MVGDFAGNPKKSIFAQKVRGAQKGEIVSPCKPKDVVLINAAIAAGGVNARPNPPIGCKATVADLRECRGIAAEAQFPVRVNLSGDRADGFIKPFRLSLWVE